MIALIEDIIKNFGGRAAGSREEYKAQKFYLDYLSSMADATQLIEFKAALKGKFGSIPIFSTILFLNFFLFWMDLKIAVLLSFINAIFFIGHFVTYQNWLDVFFTKKSSWNAEAKLEGALSNKHCVIVCGHMDCVYEFKWWYRLKAFGFILTLLGSTVIILQAIIFASILIIEPDSKDYQSGVSLIVYLVFSVLSFSNLCVLDMHGKKMVDGAIDNLSGVAIAAGLLEYFSKNRLKNIEFRAVSFGSEEVGLKGSNAYAALLKTQIASYESCLVLNVDTIKSSKTLNILSAETNPLTFYNKALILELIDSFEAKKVPYAVNSIGMGATDGTSFSRQGIPVLSIIGIDTKRPDASYHTRLDNFDNLDPKALEDLKNVIQYYIESKDKAYSG